jgi:hypothetical protein
MKPPGARQAAAFVLGASLLGALAARAEDVPRAAPDAGDVVPCLERSIVVAYLHILQDRVIDFWGVPEDSLANQEVVVRFRLAETGTLLTYKLVSWTSRRIANSVELAIAHAKPFGPIPEAASCLVGRAVEMRFENPF